MLKWNYFKRAAKSLIFTRISPEYFRGTLGFRLKFFRKNKATVGNSLIFRRKMLTNGRRISPISSVTRKIKDTRNGNFNGCLVAPKYLHFDLAWILYGILGFCLNIRLNEFRPYKDKETIT